MWNKPNWWIFYKTIGLMKLFQCHQKQNKMLEMVDIKGLKNVCDQVKAMCHQTGLCSKKVL
jgi:hypothetical protein